MASTRSTHNWYLVMMEEWVSARVQILFPSWVLKTLLESTALFWKCSLPFPQSVLTSMRMCLFLSERAKAGADDDSGSRVQPRLHPRGAGPGPGAALRGQGAEHAHCAPGRRRGPELGEMGRVTPSCPSLAGRLQHYFHPLWLPFQVGMRAAGLWSAVLRRWALAQTITQDPLLPLLPMWPHQALYRTSASVFSSLNWG